jgi:hypothetical protein
VTIARSHFTRRLARWIFHGHLWVGVATAALVAVVSLTGILLNHKRTLGLMPDPAPRSPGLDGALALAELVAAAEVAAGSAAAAGVDRMDVRPDEGVVKVRFDDAGVTEVTVALRTGEVVAVGERRDVFLEKLHSGQVFGDAWVLLSDGLAVALVLLLGTGVWIWLYPRSRL